MYPPKTRPVHHKHIQNFPSQFDCSVPSDVIVMFWLGNPWVILNFLKESTHDISEVAQWKKMVSAFTMYQVMWLGSGKLWGHCKDIQNVLSFPVSWMCPCNVPKVSWKITKNGTSWTKSSGHSECATQEHFRHTVLVHFEFYWLGTLWSHCSGHHKQFPNEPLRNTRGTFFGKIQGVPMVFPFGTSRSHDLVHCECTDRFLSLSHSGTSWVLSFRKFKMYPWIT